MWISGQWFGSEVVEHIASTVKSEPTISRRGLSRRVCEWLDWRAPIGKLRELSCRKALVQLARRGHVDLPAYEPVPGFTRPVVRQEKPPVVAEVECSLAELGEIEVVPVSSRYSKASGIWNGMLDAYHYLGGGPLCGAQIRYLVCSSQYGWLGGLSFSAATRRLKDRDQWVVWRGCSKEHGIGTTENCTPLQMSHVGLGREFRGLACQVVCGLGIVAKHPFSQGCLREQGRFEASCPD